MWIIVDVGCIECAEQTEVVGTYPTKEAAELAFDAAAKTRGIKQWEPRGGPLEMFTAEKKANETTFRGGCGYHINGQRALELHEIAEKVDA
jgi:predicted lipoprotein with Yx(FWY)xxD motif